MIKSMQTHVGQYRRYGDFFREWDIETDEPKEAVLEYCFSELYTRRVPEEAEWKANIVYGGPKSDDAGYYFGGYYSLKKTETGYYFTICEPYAD